MKAELKARMSVMREVKRTIRQPHAWPGGYPLSIICEDGGLLCPSCARENYKQVAHDTVKDWPGGWKAAGVDILWEGGNHCDHCSKCVDAYTED